MVREPVCNAAFCRTQLARETAAATAQKRWSETLRRSREQLTDAAGEILAAAKRVGLAPEQLVPVAVPLIDRPTVALGAEDRATMIGHIEQIVAESFSTGPPDPVTPDRDRLEAPVSEYLSAACMTCKGACCEVGRSYRAFRHIAPIRPLGLKERMEILRNTVRRHPVRDSVLLISLLITGQFAWWLGGGASNLGGSGPGTMAPSDRSVA